MDIGQFIFPFIMAVITNSVMIVLIYFLRKIPYFANLFSLWFMVALYLMCVLRMFLPIEFPAVQIILRDSIIYSFFVETMAARTAQATIAPNSVLYILLGIWLVGVIVSLAISFYTQKAKTTYYLANYDFTTDAERELFERVSGEILHDKYDVTLKRTDGVRYIMVIGYFKKYLLLPAKTFSEDELEMIFRHECTHIKNKDLWLKLLVHIYCCIFWWNPFSYLLKHDLGFTLEMKCDLSATQGLSNDKVKTYFETLTKNCHKKGKRDKDRFFVCAELTDDAKNKDLVKRAAAIAKQSVKRTNHVAGTVIVAIAFIAVFATSYIFIWQPFYGDALDIEVYELNDENGNGFIADDTNSYLVKQDDGNYLFYFGDDIPEHVPKEEVDEGLYYGYPIREK